MTLFGETLGATGAVPIALTAGAVVVMIVGTISLARSPLVTGERSSPRHHPRRPLNQPTLSEPPPTSFLNRHVSGRLRVAGATRSLPETRPGR